MDLAAAETLAERLMTKHGLEGWAFGFDRATTRLGRCAYGRRLITISRLFALAASAGQVEQALLHEIAHALLPTHNRWGRPLGHGPEWKLLAAAIGYTGSRMSANPYRQPG